MEEKELRAKIYSKIDEIPTLPAVVPKLLSLMEDDMTSGADIAAALSQDPALTSKLLKVSNSAYYGFSQKIVSLDKAVPLLGFNMVKSLALSIGVIRSLPEGGKSPHFSQEGLWIHSLAVATAIQELGKKIKQGGSREHLFIVGLLHDIGKVVLDLFFRDLFHKALEMAYDKGMAELHVAERRTIGFDHGDVGAMLLTRWRFPPMICDPIAVHHHEEMPEAKDNVDVALLRIADTLPQELGLGEGGTLVMPGDYDKELKVLGLEEKDLDAVRAELDQAKEGINAFFKALD